MDVCIHGCYTLYTVTGESRFCGAWSLYNFGGPLEEQGNKITDMKLGTKMNIYLKWEKITTNYKFKKADKYYKLHKIQKK